MKGEIMNYPNGNKKDIINKNINYANRGMDLENLINESNEYYIENDIAIIYKKPTPITISEVKYGVKERIITKAYFRTPSTLDYNGIYKGKYIDFDAKETNSHTSFPLSNIHPHQLLHMQRIISHGGITFLIIAMNNQIFLLDGNDILNFINDFKRKSIPYEYIQEKGILIQKKIKPRIDYINAIENKYFKE